MNKARQVLAHVLALLSALLLIATVACYWWRWDTVAAVTNFPIFVPGIGGILLALIARWPGTAAYATKLAALWLVAIILLATETPNLINLGGRSPSPGGVTPLNKLPTLRVASLNCGSHKEQVDIEAIAAFQPDVVFLQELPSYSFARELGKKLFGDGGGMAIRHPCAILTRHPIGPHQATRGVRSVFCRMTLPDGIEVQLANLHLSSSTTRLDLWNREAWEDYKQVRENHREEMTAVLDTLEIQVGDEDLPVIMGGDFNSQPNDPVFELIPKAFNNGYNKAGWGMGHTYPARFPLLRLDHLFANRFLVPGRAGTAAVDGADHHLLIVDFRYNEKLLPVGP